MPIRRTQRRRPRKARRVMRGRRRNAKRQYPALTTRMRGGGFSDIVRTKLRYVQQFTVTGAAFANRFFRGNSCYDPDQTGTGHQPMFFDQYIAVYGKYRVLASAVKIQVMNSGNASTYVVILPATVVTPVYANIDAVLEANKATSLRVVPPLQYLPQQQKRYMTTSKATGVSRSVVYSDDTYAALFNADPVNLWYWSFVFQTIDQATNIDLSVLLTMTLYVEFFDRQLVSPS